MLTADPTIFPGAHRVKVSPSRKRRSWPISARRCCIRPRCCRPSKRIFRCDSQFAPAGGGRHADCLRAVRSNNVVHSIACKRNITLVNIVSTRMLMAHGFLRRIFEIFDRYRDVGGHAGDLRGQRLADHRQPGAWMRSRGDCENSRKLRWKRIRPSCAWWAKISATLPALRRACSRRSAASTSAWFRKARPR